MKITRLLRVIHRDLGYFLVGITLIYAISGILLNHLGSRDPAFKTEAQTVQLTANLSDTDLLTACQADSKLPVPEKILPINDSQWRLLFKGGIGVYDASTGTLSYELHKKRVLVYWINRLHYNKVKDWTPVADFFAGSLILLAISGLFIVKGKRGLSGSGKWYLIIGILIPILYGIFFLK